jgi:hypothetical protein
MKVGDLVKCNWQPSSSHIEDDCAVPMKFIIKGEIGIVIDKREQRYMDCSYNVVLFPQFDYKHVLSDHTLDLLSQI